MFSCPTSGEALEPCAAKMIPRHRGAGDEGVELPVSVTV